MDKHSKLLFSPPNLEILAPVDLLLQLEDSIEQGLSCRWATWNIYINWDNPVATTDDRVGVVVVTTTICTASHGDDPPWLWHLIVDPAIIFHDERSSKTCPNEHNHATFITKEFEELIKYISYAQEGNMKPKQFFFFLISKLREPNFRFMFVSSKHTNFKQKSGKSQITNLTYCI